MSVKKPHAATPLECHVPVREQGRTAADCLAEAVPQLSKQSIKTAMNKGAVWLTHGAATRRIRRATRVLHSGDTVHLYYDETVLNRKPPHPTLIADEQRYSVWFKPNGMLSQGSRWGDHCTITRWAEQHLKPQRLSFVVHRLDRAASGLILVAHTRQAAASLSALFHHRQVDKHYRVTVHGRFPDRPAATTMDAEIDGRHAVSRVRLHRHDSARNRSLLDVWLETGRKHQIRRHLAWAGYPVVGDRLYGNPDEQENLQLTAMTLSFRCPFAREIKTYQLPETLTPDQDNGTRVAPGERLKTEV